MAQVDFSLDDFKKLLDERLDERFLAEREHTRALLLGEREYTKSVIHSEREHTKALIKEGNDYVIAQFHSFIDDNFMPAMDKIDQRFERLEDCVDHISSDMTALRIDMRYVKQTLRSGHRAAT